MTGRALVEPGDVVSIAEPDYMYGTGLLRLRVTAIDSDIQRLNGANWVHAEGVAVTSTGQDIGPRKVLVRVGALRR